MNKLICLMLVGITFVVLNVAQVQGAESVCSLLGDREPCGGNMSTSLTAIQCVQRGCCWGPFNSSANNNDAFPFCFKKKANVNLYYTEAIIPTFTGMLVHVKCRNCSLSSTTRYGSNVENLTVEINYDTNTRLHVKINDGDNKRWEIPNSLISRSNPVRKASNPQYQIRVNPPGTVFGFKIVSGTTTIFDTTSPSVAGMLFKDQLLSINTQLPGNSVIYGLGESTQDTLNVEAGVYTLFARDCPAATKLENRYASHPFYLQMQSGLASGVFLMNSNGMDLIKGTDNTLQYRVLGGVLDFYFFAGPTPENVVQQYSALIGKPHMPPYWSLGFHQCRYGYPNIEYVEEVVANYSAAGIPLETMWNDIDYMDHFKDWTWDPVNYPQAKVKAFAEKLNAKKQHYVTIIDPAIKNETGYFAFDDLIAAKAYIQRSITDDRPFLGQVWPHVTVFPDFLNPAAHVYWKKMIKGFIQGVPVSGLWIDMNEPASFCMGEYPNGCYYPSMATPSKQVSADPHTFKHPQYLINNANNVSPLEWHTVAPNAIHMDPTTGKKNALEYDVHNLFGFTEGIATMTALESVTDKRSFIISRSTFPGSGKYVGHWTGDNAATWNDLRWSIVEMMQFNLFNIPMIGSDICGFIGNTDEELCTRWIQTGAFYPFSRDHSEIHATVYQELYRWPQVAQVARNVLTMRYQLLPYYYTLFFKANTNGDTVIRPLFFEFPSDTKALTVNQQFMVGDALMVAPCVTKGETTVDVYFPQNGDFYDYQASNGNLLGRGQTISVDTPITSVNVYQRAGSILPNQALAPEMTTYHSRMQPFTFIVAYPKPDASSPVTSIGSLYLDDGESLNSTTAGGHTLISLSAILKSGGTSGSFTTEIKSNAYPITNTIEKIVFKGVSINSDAKVSVSIKVNGQSQDAEKFTASLENHQLELTGLSLPLNQPIQVAWAKKTDNGDHGHHDPPDQIWEYIVIAGVGSLIVVSSIWLFVRKARKHDNDGNSDYEAIEDESN